VIKLARIKMHMVNHIFAACPDNGNAQAVGKSRFKVDSSSCRIDFVVAILIEMQLLGALSEQISLSHSARIVRVLGGERPQGS